MIRKIVGAKDPILKRPSKPVLSFDRKLSSLVKDLKDTLLAQKDPEGVGLAAPQIGKSVRVFVMRDVGKVRAIVNPEIISQSKEVIEADDQKIMEGCLSLPHYYGPLGRAKSVKLKYQTDTGEQKTREFSGFPAQIIQHEVDHLSGIMFVEKLLEQKKRLYKQEGEDWVEIELI